MRACVITDVHGNLHALEAVLAAVAERAEVLDLSIEEPDIEDVVREIYRATGR
jgi:ABC-type uncharacterized transport system ATPase subunit